MLNKLFQLFCFHRWYAVRSGVWDITFMTYDLHYKVRPYFCVRCNAVKLEQRK